MSRLEEIKQRLAAAKPAPYRVERVDHEPDEITYEVSASKTGFHVVFRESECWDRRCSAKDQSELYAHAPQDLADLIRVVEMYEKALEEVKERTITDPAEGPELRARAACVYACATKALAEAKKVMNGEC